MHLLDVILSFPTVAFTVLVGLMLVYWAFVLFGALDLDFLSGGDQAVEGAIHGHADALMGGGHVDGALEGHADGAFEGHGDGALEGAEDGAGNVLGALKLRKAPVTVVTTLFATFGWLLSGLAILSLPETLGFLPRAGIFVGSAIVSLLLTSLAIRPLAPVFETRTANKDDDLIGKVVVVSTGSVTSTFGQALLEDGGAGLTLQVRVEKGVALKKGDRCLIIEADKEHGTFIIEDFPEATSELPRNLRVDAADASHPESGDSLSGSEIDSARDNKRRV